MAVADALADVGMAHGDTTPTGTGPDMTTRLPLVDPAQVKAPVLLIRGEHAGIATMADLLAVFERRPNGDRAFRVLSHAAHSLTFGIDRAQFRHAPMPSSPPRRLRGRERGR